ncbi:GntR family transcriptional regulator [Trinickia acidisoli]|uniref:GntR family transcriptional regulator n=1 Tax=Trinickia acidisoli TaxID=2767482 RepID=UPI001A8F25B5|nr:GntR family transcriptional regulator [Trinickia acidisoli]
MTKATKVSGRSTRVVKSESPKPEGLQGQSAYEKLREAILDCDLKPGESVSQPDLMERFDLRAAAVRYGLTRLAQEEWVSVLPKKGWIIAPITLQDVDEVFRLRLELEPACVRWVAGRIDTKQLEAMERLCRQAYAPGNHKSEKRFLRANRDLHLALVDAAANKRLSRIMRDLHDEALRMFHVCLRLSDQTTVWQHQHHDLIEAIRCGDGVAAEKIMREQIDDGRRFVMNAFMRSPIVASVNLSV